MTSDFSGLIMILAVLLGGILGVALLPAKTAVRRFLVGAVVGALLGLFTLIATS